MDEYVDNSIIQHLLFHKALIDEQDDAQRINYYVDLLTKTNEGLHVSMKNPFDRSIAIAFELVMQQHLNPWDLDLVSFSTMYLHRAKEEHVDLITAGRIILMAWKILKLQSNDLMINLQNQEMEQEQADWDALSSEMWFTTDDEYSYTNLLMKLPDPPLEEPIRRHTKRKVTLIELLEAFDLARKEAEAFQQNEKRRQEAKHQLFEASRKRMIGTAHEDNIEADVSDIWDRIQRIGKENLSISELYEGNDKEEIIRIFISILFLANEQKIIVYQRRFPYGKIFIKTVGYT
jgi:segregation and condensation protein A